MHMRTRLGFLAAGLLLVTVGLATTAPVAQAKPVPSPGITITASVFAPIRNVGSNKCLQPENGSLAEFAPIVQNTCVAGSFAQGWEFRKVGNSKDNHYMFLNQQSGFCLDVFGGAVNGTRLLQVTCKRISNEEFNTGTPLPAVTKIESRVGFTNTGFCVDVPGGESTEGRAMQIFRCNGTPAQVWVIGF